MRERESERKKSRKFCEHHSSTTYFGLITRRHRFVNEKKVITARVYRHLRMFRFIGQLPFFSHFSFSPTFFFTSYNTHLRTGMTNIDDILERKKTGKKWFFAPLLSLFPIYNLQRYISSGFFWQHEECCDFFLSRCHAWATIFFGLKPFSLSLFFLSLVVAILIMFVLARKVPALS